MVAPRRTPARVDGRCEGLRVRVGVPRLELSATDVRVVSRLTDERGDSFDLYLAVDRSLVGLVDAGTTPFLPVATVAASYLGEDVTVETPVSPAVAAGAERATRRLVGRWGDRPVTVHGPRREPGFTVGPGRGLFFFARCRFHVLTRSICACRDAGLHTSPGRRRSRPLGLTDHTGSFFPPHPSDRSGCRSPSRLLHDECPGTARSDCRLGTCPRLALLLLRAADQPLLRSATLGASFSLPYAERWRSHPDIEMWSSETTAIEHDGDDTTRPDKLMYLAQEPDLLRQVKVCWAADTAGNCGRCPKCLLTMTVLDVLGALEPGVFDAELDLDALADARFAMSSEMLREQLDWLEARPETTTEFRRAWLAHGRQHGELADDVGDVTREGGNEGPREALLGSIVQTQASGSRPVAWCLVDVQSEGAVALADRLTARWGPGLCYLEGVPWDGDQPSGLSAAAKDRIMGTSRIRLWWSDGDELDSGRMYESLRNGCVPLQAMTAGAAGVLRPKLSRGLRDYVLACGPDRTPPLPDADECDRIRRRAVSLVGVAATQREILVDHG
ncbi:MAG: hypothetical protein M5U31_01740 [Acidimicrobiia bacterium]|nr:hypothetical protein [Acidimicrobiia bacterium]